MTGDGADADDGDGGRTRGVAVLVVAALVFAVLLMPWALEDDGGSGDIANTVPATATSRVGSVPAPGGTVRETGSVRETGTVRETDSVVPAPTLDRPAPGVPTQVRDPRAEAFRAAARRGTCLNAFQTGADEGAGWNSEVPRIVDCSSGYAYVRVAGVNTSCPIEDMAVASWAYGDVSLCLERLFKPGQCFLARRTGGPESNPVYNADLFTWVDCDAQRVPVPYNAVLVISGAYRAPATIPSRACSRSANDRTHYWYWTSSAQESLICATFPAR